MGLFSRGNKNNNPTQSEKKSLFGGKTFRPESVEDYRNYSERQLFAQFKSENWNVKEPDDKIAVLQELENREAAAHNRPAAKVVQAYGSSYGGYNSGTHRIEIRLTDNQFEDLDTLFHESEHANQSKAPINSVSFSENDKKLMSVEDMTSSDGIRSHYSKYGSSLYKVMTSELDANNAALEKVSSLKSEYMDEEKYQEYLAGRQEYYDGLVDAIDIKSPDKKAALLNTVEGAYARDELSESEYSELKELIINTDNYDLCEMRTVEINEVLSQVNLQDRTSVENLSLYGTSESSDVHMTAAADGQVGIPRYQVVNADSIQNINHISDNFWNHHGNSKEDYMELASKLPEIQKEFAEGKTYSEILANPELHDTLVAYYSDDKMIQVVQDQNGSYQFQDDGRHRVMAAQELGYSIPVNVINSEEPVIAYYYENQQGVKAISVEPEEAVSGIGGGVQPDKEPYQAIPNDQRGLDQVPIANSNIGVESDPKSVAKQQLTAYMHEHNYGKDDFAEYSQDPEWRVLQRAAYPEYEMPPLAQDNAQKQLTQYMNEHNYGKEDYAEYSQDPVWRELHAAAYPGYEMPLLTQEDAQKQLTQYMNEHNYGKEDYAEYSQDPVWRELHAAAYPEHELPPLNESKDVSDDTRAKMDSAEAEIEEEEAEDEELETAEEEAEDEKLETAEEEAEDEESETVEEETEDEESETEEETEDEESETEEEVEDEESETAEEETEDEESETSEEETEDKESETEEEVEDEESETAEEETEDEESETSEEETEDEESETAEEEAEDEESETEEEEAEESVTEEETEEVETEEAETEEVETEEVETEEVETEEVEAEDVEVEETETEEVETEEVEAEDVEVEETETEEVETEEVEAEDVEVEETETEEVETEDVEAEDVEVEETETEEVETEEVEAEEVEAEDVEVEETETEEVETEEVEAEDVEVEETETEEVETEEVEAEDVEVEETETEEVEAEDVEVEETETEEVETEEVEAEDVEVEEVETEELETEELETEEVGAEELESEDMNSAMLDDVEYEDSGYEEDSVMVEDLDNTEEVTDMENNSEMIDDLGETESVDSSMSESYDYSSSGDGMSSDGGGMDME